MKSKLLQLLFVLVALVGVNVLANFFFFRIDLTEEKRYSLSDGTINLLENLPSDVVVKVYLDGEMPAGFKRLQSAVRETLEEFKVHAGNKINYRFVNPDDFSTEKERKEFYEDSFACAGGNLKNENG